MAEPTKMIMSAFTENKDLWFHKTQIIWHMNLMKPQKKLNLKQITIVILKELFIHSIFNMKVIIKCWSH